MSQITHPQPRRSTTRIKYAIASLAVGGSLAASAIAGAEPASADPTTQMSSNLQQLQLQLQTTTQMSPLQQVQLQSQTQKVNRSAAAMSNIMQTNQVTVTNVIGNIRP